MADASQILKLKDLVLAKQHLNNKIQEYVEKHPHTQKENIQKAQKMIESNSNLEKLSIAVANFVLSHPSEGLKVI